MKRRDFIVSLGAAIATPALAWPIAARAQQPAMPVIGFLNPTSPAGYPHVIAAFHQGLRESGYVDGQNVAIEYRWAEGQNKRLPALAADLVRHQVMVIAATGGDTSALAAKAATQTIPIVFNSGGDPVRTGLVASLNRPGGNLTGVSRLGTDLLPKRLELLAEAAPKAGAIAFLLNPTLRDAASREKDVRLAAQSLGRQIHVLNASSDSEVDAAFASLAQLKIGALLIVNDSFFNTRSERLGALSLRHAVPTIYQNREFVAAGGLLSYGASLSDAYRLVGIYTGRVLKGEKPADLPVQQQTKVDFFVNLKTARALGLTIPLPLLALADEVIE
jgi:putative ABC transport system substrate-binding protein